jgi:hypothetical protein
VTSDDPREPDAGSVPSEPNPFLDGYESPWYRRAAPAPSRRADVPPPATPRVSRLSPSRTPWLTLLVSLLGVGAASATTLMLYRQHQAMERQLALMEQQNQNFVDANRGAIDIARGNEKVKQGNALIAEGKALIRQGRGMVSKRAPAASASRATSSRDARAATTGQTGSVVETTLRRYRVQLNGAWTDAERRQLLRRWAAACDVEVSAILPVPGGYEFQSPGCVAGTFDDLKKR